MIAVVIGAGLKEGIEFSRGDCDQDGGHSLSDAVRCLSYLFRGGTADCLDACDSNDTGVLELTDAVHDLSYLFRGTAEPPAPFPGCGVDPTEDTLDCAESVCP